MSIYLIFETAAEVRDAVPGGAGRARQAARGHVRARAHVDAGTRRRLRGHRAHTTASAGLQRFQAHQTAPGGRGHTQQSPAGMNSDVYIFYS